MRVEPLARAHDRKNFDCGTTSLNDWLANQAGQAQTKHRSARTFILTEDGVTIVGYYSLASHSVDFEAVSPEMSKGQGRDFPIPAALLARLAIATTHQRQGLGERLLADAVRQVIEAGKAIGIALMVVDALDDNAAGFYEQYGFKRWPADELRLFAKVKDLADTMT